MFFGLEWFPSYAVVLCNYNALFSVFFALLFAYNNVALKLFIVLIQMFYALAFSSFVYFLFTI